MPSNPVVVHDDLTVSRTEDELPFAQIVRLREHRSWRVAYRDGDGFVPGGNCSFPTKAKAIAECQWAADHLTPHQLGVPAA